MLVYKCADGMVLENEENDSMVTARCVEGNLYEQPSHWGKCVSGKYGPQGRLQQHFHALREALS